MTITDNILYFDACNTNELAEQYGTPLIVLSESELIRKSNEIRDDFLEKYDNVRAVYASKAFLNTAICKIINREGLGLDVVSGGELYTALHAQFPAEKIIFHGNNKSYAELKMAIEAGVGRIVVDNASELDLIAHLTSALNLPVNILFRITPGIHSDTHAYIATADKDSKFGFPLETIPSAYALAEKSPNIIPLGLHFHVGSQLQNTTAHLSALDVALGLIEQLHDMGTRVFELNTGGGYGVKYTETDTEMPLRDFTDPIMARLKSWASKTGIDRPQIIIEPGRWLVANAGLTLYRVGASKHIPGIRTYISVDGGIPDNIRPALYTAKYRAVIANKMQAPLSEAVTIAGKCCESGDILIKDIRLPQTRRGDLLAVFGTGAYTESMSSNYNYLPRPAVVLVNQGHASLIRTRESYSDLIRRDIVPKYLE